jgi:prevent-host-death family protein
MTARMTATELKARVLAVLDDVATGEEVEITKHGRLVARLVPARGAVGLDGSLEGIAMSATDDELLFSTGESWDLA